MSLRKKSLQIFLTTLFSKTLIASQIKVKSYCLTGPNIDDCAMVQDVYIHKDNKIEKALVTKKSIVNEFRNMGLDVYAVDDKDWKNIWVESDNIWNKDITFIRPGDYNPDKQGPCFVVTDKYEFVTYYKFNEK